MLSSIRGAKIPPNERFWQIPKIPARMGINPMDSDFWGISNLQTVSKKVSRPGA
jgi:hypothetical protein